MPDTPVRTITFDFRLPGEPHRTLRFDYAALEWVDAATGGRMIEVLGDAVSGRRLSHTHLRIFLQAALRHAEPAITAQTVRDRIEHYCDQADGYIGDIVQAVAEACGQCRLLQQRPEAEADPDPPAPAAAGRRAPGPTTSRPRSGPRGETSRSTGRRSRP